MPNVNMFVPPEEQEELASIERSRKYAELLRAQSAPQEGKMVSGHYIPPGALSYVTQILGGALAGQQSKAADAKALALAQKLGGAQKDWLGSMPKATPEQQVSLQGPTPDGAPLTGTQPAQNPTGGDFLNWAMKGMSVNPQMAQAGFGMADRLEARDAQSEAQKAAQEQRIQELQIRSEDARLGQQERMAAQAQARKEQQEFQMRMAQEQRQHSMDMARMTMANRPAPTPNLVQVAGPDGQAVYMDARQAVGKAPYQKPAVAGASAASEDERKAAGWLSQADKAYADMLDARKSDPKASKPGLIESLPGLPEAVKNVSRSDGRQKFNQAASAFSEASLRAATGAGVNQEEALQKVRELTPQWGDSDAVIEQKTKSQQMYLDSLHKRASRAAPVGYQAPGASSSSPAGGRNITVDW